MFRYIGQSSFHLSTAIVAIAWASLAAMLSPSVPWLVLRLCGAL